MAELRRLVLDVLKPHDPSIVTFTERIVATDGVEHADATLIELDREVQNVALEVSGSRLSYAGVEEAVKQLGGTVHSVDEVTYRDESASEGSE